MDRNLLRVGGAMREPHTLVMAAPTPRGRRRWGTAFFASAILAGMAAALVWLMPPNFGSRELLSEEPTAQEQTAQAATATPTPSPAAIAPLQRAQVLTGVIPGVLMPNPAALRNVDLRTVVAPPTATPTRTPVPPLDSVEAVAGRAGATLWDEAGSQVAQVEQGALLTVQARSTDGAWLYATTADGVQGWVAADELIVSDASRLRSQDVVIIPLTPTPGQAGGQVLVPTASAPAAGTPIPEDAPTAQVVADGSRLNVRAGPGPAYPVLAQAQPGETLVLLGRDSTGDWLQVALPAVAGGFGWVAADYVETGSSLDDLPVSSAVNEAEAQAAPPAGDEPGMLEDEATKGGEVGGQTGAALQVALYPTPDPVRQRAARPKPASASATGLHGKLVIQQTWGGSIYIYELTTGELRLLTGGFDPSFSPDGGTVAFTRAGGDHGLYLIGVDGSNERLIFSGREQLRSPKFSPDGQYIVFERGDEQVVCWQADGNCLTSTPQGLEFELTTETQHKLARVDINGQNYQDIPVLHRAHAPDWNSAGIVYHSPAGIQKTQDVPGARSELVFFNIQKQYELDPDWQPNGGRIIFQRREASRWEIFSVNPDGAGLTALTYPTFTLVEELPSNVAPAWSPDGRHIVFLSNRMPNESAGRWNVWVMDADGGRQHPLPIDLDFTYTFVAEQMLDWGR
jgi:uncharacterized protein YraI